MEVIRDANDSDVEYLSDPEMPHCSGVSRNFGRMERKNHRGNNSESSDSDDEYIPKRSTKFVEKSAIPKKRRTIVIHSSDSDDESMFVDQSAIVKANNTVIISDSSNSDEETSDDRSEYAAATNEETASNNFDPREAENRAGLVRQHRRLKLQVARLKKLRALKAKIPSPDGDEKMQKKIASAEQRLRKVTEKLWPVRPGDSKTEAKPAPLFKENSLEIDPAYLLPKTNQVMSQLGKAAQVTLNREQSVTMERLQDLHGSLVDRPAEDELAEDPRGLKSALMRHQKHALAWMLWRESQQPRGGILADDMGLGKTLTMIALVLASAKKAAREVNDDEDEWKSSERNYRHRGGTLVVVPTSLISQWVSEIKKRCSRGALTVAPYHGSDRTTSQTSLARNDIVITSYGMVVQSLKYEGILNNIRWRRIILDEAHMIRNHKSRSCVAVCDLVAETRWALTGTPIQNKQMDIFAIMKFLQCSPFDDVRIWRRWIEKAGTAGTQRLATILKVLMLRRTKKELQATREIESLPDKTIEDIVVALDPEERLVYDKVMVYSRSLFAKFLAQKAEKARAAELDDGFGWMSTYTGTKFTEAQDKLLSMHADVSPIVILVVLLRLRQMCCHPWLISAMLDRDDIVEAGASETVDDKDDLLSEINKIGMECFEEEIGVDRRVIEHLLTSDNPVFDRKRQSSKIRAVLAKVTEILATGDKQIVVSQWTSVIDILADELESVKGASFSKFTGKMTMPQRERVLRDFNSPQAKPNILLLSLKAGGVGLNLVGANHLLLVDIHWNPQLERQAQDRIYRLGQRKDIHVYKYICDDTIEEQIKFLQSYKLRLASSLLSPGGEHALGSNKLSLDDLKMLFGVSR